MIPHLNFVTTTKTMQFASKFFSSGQPSDTDEKKLISLTSSLNAVASATATDGFSIHPHRICSVGLQSSGKSSVINNITGFPILPVASGIATRCPTHLEMYTSSESRVILGAYTNSEWIPGKTLPLSDSPEDIATIQSHVMRSMTEVCGSAGAVSQNPIYVRVYSPNVPNLIYIDTPGIIAFPDEKKGQTPAMVSMIKDIVASYISVPNTIILCVIAARPDVNADFGMGYVKQFDPDCRRTICAMTKVDTLSISLSNFCTQTEVAQQVGYGYYLLRNRDSKEMSILTLAQGLRREMEFFAGSEFYKGLGATEKSHLGTENLKKQLSRILLEETKRMIPQYRKQVLDIKCAYETQLLALGASVPSTPQEKSLMLSVLINEIALAFTVGCQANDDLLSSPLPKIASRFDAYRECIGKIAPFTTKTYPDEYIRTVIRNADGLDMACSIPSMKVISFCLRDPSKAPFALLVTPSTQLVYDVVQVLQDLMIKILSHERYSRFPALVSKCSSVFDGLIHELSEVTIDRIKDDIKSEEFLTYTSDTSFIQKIAGAGAEKVKLDMVRTLLETYYATVVKTIAKTTPNKIMYLLFHRTVTSLCTTLCSSVSGPQLLVEEPEVEATRKRCTAVLQRITYILEHEIV